MVSSTVIAAFDWTVVVTAVSTLEAAAVGYLAGAVAARIQAKAQLEQLQFERTEAQRRARQGVYLDFLNAANGLLTLTQHKETITQDRFFAWLDDYTRRYNALLLLGVREASTCALAVLGEIPSRNPISLSVRPSAKSERT